MKKGILLFLICLNISYSLADSNKQVLLKDFRSVFIPDEIDLRQDTQDLLFQYQVYKKLIQDNFLDQLIKDSGFEPNQETRTIFFSALTKELQDVIKKSFTDFAQNNNGGVIKNNTSGPINNGFDPNLFLQADMTRNLSTALASLNSNLNKTKEFKIKNVFLLGLITYIVAKSNIITGTIKTSYNYIKAKENIKGKSSRVISFIDRSINKIKVLGRDFLGLVIPVDHSQGHDESAEFFKFYEYFERYLKSDKEFVENGAVRYEYVDVGFKRDGKLFQTRIKRNANLKLD
ncbi:MAG: hypothetical protein ABIF12_02540 [bacterium]